MNKIFKNVLFMLNITFMQLLLPGILINNVDINTLTTPELGRIVFDIAYDNIQVLMRNGKIEISQIPLEKDMFSQFAQGLQDDLNCILYNKQNLSRYIFSNDYLFSAPNISFNDSYLKAKEIVLDAFDSLVLHNILIESPNIYFSGNRISAQNCFINGDMVQLESNNKDSFLSIIRFTFKDKVGWPFLKSIWVELNCNEIDPVIFCLGTGISKIEILFLPKAFTYNN